jgi:hypothetical protein
MTQANKKSAQHASAKLASNVANKAAKHGLAAVESTRSSAEHVVKIGSNAVKEFMSSSASEAQKAQEKVYEVSREQAEQFAKSADTLTKMMYDAVSTTRDNVETCIECGNMTAAMAKDVSSELYEYANKAFTDNVELSKEFFACRTFNDVFDLQNKLFRSSIDQFFNESVKLSGMMFEYTTEALEPINERVAQATEQFSKTLAA